MLAAGIVYCFSWEVLSFSFCFCRHCLLFFMGSSVILFLLLQALSTVFHGKFCHSLSAFAGIVYCFSWEVLSFSFCFCRHCLLFFMGSSVILFLLLQALSTVFHGKFCHSLSAFAGIVYCFSWEVLSFSFCFCRHCLLFFMGSSVILFLLLQALSTVFHGKFCHSLSAFAGIVYCFSWEVLSFSFCFCRHCLLFFMGSSVILFLLLQALSTVFHGKFCHSLSAFAGIVYCFSWEVLSFSFCFCRHCLLFFPERISRSGQRTSKARDPVAVLPCQPGCQGTQPRASTVGF